MAGKKFSIFGDSISTLEGYIPAGWRNYYEGAEADETGVHAYEDTWWGQVIAHFGGELLANASYSGSMVEGADFPAGNSPERIAALGGTVPACGSSDAAVAYNPMSESHPDVILAFIGINDYGWGSAAAEVLGASAAAPVASARTLGNDVYGHVWTPAELPSAEEIQVARVAFQREAAANPRVRLAHFAQAYNLMLSRMRESYPEADIWCCTLVPGRLRGMQTSTHTYNLRGIPFADYNQVIREVAACNGAHVADIAAAGQDYEASDGTHPTKFGMQQLSSLVIAAMMGEPFPTDPIWQSTNPCVLTPQPAGFAPTPLAEEALRELNHARIDTVSEEENPSPVSSTSPIASLGGDVHDVTSTSASTPRCCETCSYADIDVQHWSCVCNASIKPL